jgi:putrescine transport system substrate-binding protein
MHGAVRPRSGRPVSRAALPFAQALRYKNAMRKGALAAAAAATIAIALVACGRKAGDTADGAATAVHKAVNVYNWSDYIDPGVLERFKSETGVDVRYDVFDSNEVLETKLLTGKSGYDVVVPSAYFLERQVKAGVFRPLDRSRLPNLANVDPEIARLAAAHDPGNEHSVVYMWGTTGIGYDKDKVAAIMPEAPVDSWSFVFDPKVISRFKDCGVSVLDDPTDMVSTMLLWLGKDPASEDPADLRLAEEKLLAIRPYIRTIHSSQYIDDLANGEVCVVIGYSGDILQAADRAAEAGMSHEIAYSIPREGALMWFDTLAIPADAPHTDEAHAFIDFLMRPDVAAANSNFVHYASANLAAMPLLDAELRDDPSIYPTPEVKARLRPNLAKSAEFTRDLNRTWTRFTTGR